MTRPTLNKQESFRGFALLIPATIGVLLVAGTVSCQAGEGTLATTRHRSLGAAAGTCQIAEIQAEPTIYDCSGAKDHGKAIDLVRRAKAGLGFPPAEGPRVGDYMFVGRHYLAWIDNTGYSGKLNGLWALNGDPADLDFTMTEPTHLGDRPISMLLPGEDGDGRWPRAYNGAEHYEIPRFKNGRHDSQAGIREANHFTDAPAWWRECINSDDDASRWDRPVGTTAVELGDHEVSFRNEAPLTIVARFYRDSYPCGSDYPVDEANTTELRLVSGYTFHADLPEIERHYQMVNAGDRAVANQGIEKLIGGQLLTDWPRPHYLKQYQNFVAWDQSVLKPYAPLNYNGDGQKGDLIDIHGTGQLLLSAVATPQAGRSIAMSQQIENAGEDFGICLCMVHGGFEFTGSVLAGQQIPARTEHGPSRGSEQLRLLSLPHASSERAAPLSQQIRSTVIQAEDGGADWHQTGGREGEGWSSGDKAGDNQPGFLLYKRYIPSTKGDVGQAAFYLAIHDSGSSEAAVAVIDLVANGKQILATKTISGSAFFATGTVQRFVLDFAVPSDGTVEPRVRWLGGAVVSLDAVVLNVIAAR